MNKIFILSLIIISKASSQNIDLYLSLIDEGKIEGVKENLPEMISKYPNNPGLLYIRALLTIEGKESLILYNEILKKYSTSKYAPYSEMKIGEYFYAKGLYTQAATLLKNIPIKYPRFPDIQRATSLMVNSFNAIGEADSARYYGLIIKSMFPKIEIGDNQFDKKSKPLAQVFNFNKKVISEQGSYVVQIGAFGSRKNANRLKIQVSQLGHNVSINEVESNGKKLHAVRVIRFKSKAQAERVGKDIKSKLGINYRVLYRPIGK